MQFNIRSHLDHASFEQRSNEHRARIDALLGPFFEDRGHGVRHAVLDFLVEYYSFRKSKLLTWSPGVGVAVEHASTEALPGTFWVRGDGYSTVSAQGLTESKRARLRWILSLLQAVERRAPVFHCHGLHEWAMVYRAKEVRHPYLNLRLPAHEIDALVESQPLGCSHVDAFRFFTEDARPLNRFQPDREQQILLDQPGCLHVTMDLYKWGYKAWPWISSDVIADALELAIETRVLDMQASPYDVRMYGYEPVAIETVAGRRAYAERQEALSLRAVSVRARLIASYSLLVGEDDAGL